MGRELEWKFRCDGETFAKIKCRFGPFRAIAMETAYFDTPQRDLNRLRWTLRRRLENGTALCTAKIPLPDGSRGEWETESDSIEAALEALCRLGAPEELAQLSQGGLVQVCGARFTRLAATLTQAQCTLELALDEGALLGGGQALPLREIEVEWKQGSEEAARAFAGQLAAEFGLETEPKSKVQRAMELIK